VEDNLMNEMYDMMNKMSQSAFDNARRLGEIQLKLSEKLMEQQVDLTNAFIESSVKGLELVGKAKGYQELVSGQAELVRDYSQKVLEGYRAGTDVVTEVRESLTKMVDENVAEASKTMKAATAKKAA
jgi:phasin family protein